MRKRWSARLALTLLAIAACGPPVWSSGLPDDRGGVLYLALAPELKYERSVRYCGLSATPLPSEAIVTGRPSREPQIAYLLAAFPDSASPELGGLCFGVRCTGKVEILRWSTCEGVMQMATNDWPSSGEGIMLAVAGGADTSRVVELAWLAIDASGPGKLELGPHPSPRFGAHFSTATWPAEAPIADLGSLGFGEPGYTPVLKFPGPALGAACVNDSICVLLTKLEADRYGAKVKFWGEGVRCAPELCREKKKIGACCFADTICLFTTRKSCTNRGGRYQGEGTNCTPNPCLGKAGGGPEGETR